MLELCVPPILQANLTTQQLSATFWVSPASPIYLTLLSIQLKLSTHVVFNSPAISSVESHAIIKNGIFAATSMSLKKSSLAVLMAAENTLRADIPFQLDRWSLLETNVCQIYQLTACATKQRTTLMMLLAAELQMI